jgi:GNAT superfamily N-acetyltransferase
MNDLTWQRLIPAEYHRILPLFEGYLGDPLMHAVIESRRPGQVYADERQSPKAAVVWTETECLYVAADPPAPSLPQAFRQLLQAKLIPIGKDLDMDFVSLFAHPQGLVDILLPALAELEPLRTPSNTFIFNRTRFESQRLLSNGLPAGLRLADLTTELLFDPENEGLLDGVLHYWGTVDHFLHHSSGYGVLDGEKLVSWLYVQAIGAGGQAPDSWTDPEYRGQGLASQLGSYWIEKCLADGMRPFWINDDVNRASRHLAERLGFDYSGNIDLIDVPFYPYDFYKGMARHFFLINDSYREAAESFERAFALADADPSDYYLAAAAWMHAGEPRRAMENLHRAVDHGLEDLLALEGTEAFDDLHESPEWDNLVQHYLRSRRMN